MKQNAFYPGNTQEEISSQSNDLGVLSKDSDAYYNLGIKLNGQGRVDEAIACYRKVVEINPLDIDAYYNMAVALSALGMTENAINCYQNILEINPNDAQAYNNLGVLFKFRGNLEKAVSCYHKAIDINPAYVQAYNNLGNALKDQGRIDAAIQYYNKAIEINPHDAESYYNMGVAKYYQAEILKAISYYRKALEIDPHFTKAHCNLLLAMNFDPYCANSDFLYESNAWWKNHGAGQAYYFSHTNFGNRTKRLKIGYVSPDFHQHSVSYFFLPLLAGHDRNNVEIFCYSDTSRPDGMTDRIMNLADHWCPSFNLPDEALANQIYKDSIDILVDLSGHTAHNRLTVFACKPAPIQVSWLGYPNTTGLPLIDYRFTDNIADPDGEVDRYYVETLIRLTSGFLCYSPPDDAPEINPSNDRGSGPVTFGSFNNIAKINTKVIDLWSQILRKSPGSILVLKNNHHVPESTKSRYLNLFHQNGIEFRRVRILAHIPSLKDHLSQYNDVDIALDPFPYNGTTTTCEALWMGTPVITLRGDRHSSRVGASILTRINRHEWIAECENDYVSKAIELASNRSELARLRGKLRQQMINSPLCDSTRFAESVESAYREMWIKWCENKLIGPT